VSNLIFDYVKFHTRIYEIIRGLACDLSNIMLFGHFLPKNSKVDSLEI